MTGQLKKKAGRNAISDGTNNMKSFTINIATGLEGVEVIVKNGRKFQEAIIAGAYKTFEFTTNEEDAERLKKFAVKKGDDKNSNRGNWYAHCNGYAMDLFVGNAGKTFSLNTYRNFGRNSK